MSDELLRMRSISKSFGSVKALEGAGLTLRTGEVHALMGENGAGKSTLIKVLTGVHRPDQGRIELDQAEIRPRSTREAEALGISTVYQEVNLIPTMSVADNIVLGRQPTRFGFLDHGAIRRRAEDSLKRLGLALEVDRLLGSCSIAVQQMVAIARALDIEAKLLILDEPTSSLDEREVDFLFQVLRRLREQGMAILFVTHFLDQVYAISDAITVLRNGAFVGEYKTPELPRLKLIEAMLGRAASGEARTGELAPSASATAPATASAKAPFLRTDQLQKRGWMSPVTLRIEQGEVTGLAGLLGSGRTETAKMLFGIQPASEGTIELEGRGVRIRSPRQAIELGLGFCSEDRKAEGLIPHLSVRENMMLAMQASRGPLRLLSSVEQETMANHYLAALNIKTASIETPVMNLSGGNQQKVLLARWLALQPKLIILDEPTRGIDVGAKAEIEKLIGSLRAKGMSVLFISSEIEEVVRNCQRVTVLRDRKQVGELTGDQIQVGQIMNIIAHHEG